MKITIYHVLKNWQNCNGIRNLSLFDKWIQYDVKVKKYGILKMKKYACLLFLGVCATAYARPEFHGVWDDKWTKLVSVNSVARVYPEDDYRLCSYKVIKGKVIYYNKAKGIINFSSNYTNKNKDLIFISGHEDYNEKEKNLMNQLFSYKGELTIGAFGCGNTDSLHLEHAIKSNKILN